MLKLAELPWPDLYWATVPSECLLCAAWQRVHCSRGCAERQAVAAKPRPWAACAVACHGTKPGADRRRTGGRL